MSESAQIKWYGKEISEKTRKAKKKFLITAGLIVSSDAKTFIQLNDTIDTGRLVGSVTYETIDEQGKIQSPATDLDRPQKPYDDNTVIVGTNVSYSTIIEEGTPSRKPNPFLRPAYDGNKARLNRVYETELKKALK